MKKSLLLASMIFCVACQAGNPKVINLSSTEKAKVLGIAIQRQQISLDRQVAQATFQAAVDKLNEQDNQLNIESQKLCFSIKQAHSLGVNTSYLLDESKGQLILQ